VQLWGTRHVTSRHTSEVTTAHLLVSHCYTTLRNWFLNRPPEPLPAWRYPFCSVLQYRQKDVRDADLEPCRGPVGGLGPKAPPPPDNKPSSRPGGRAVARARPFTFIAFALHNIYQILHSFIAKSTAVHPPLAPQPPSEPTSYKDLTADFTLRQSAPETPRIRGHSLLRVSIN
jgi:hypothetical protein